MNQVRIMDLWKICICSRPRIGALLLVVVRCFVNRDGWFHFTVFGFGGGDRSTYYYLGMYLRLDTYLFIYEWIYK